ncbi:Trypsin-like peptidase domain-containing protein [Roseivivax lentus]|uniref:Trypsin-like peptidase domain-containing protein n=1 Tax=Roseivivax lentus TaxID=633194 RepID=A0A1N7MZI1_9RHOB|nr:serine protease [Roseivivax lentus]SIS91289.1 Trypsin-like peptidase domain-containing protein [Roseivivax lentus]
MRALLLALTLLATPAAAQDLSIGRLFGGGFSSVRLCTATLVGPATLLTAAHCVTLPDGRARSPMGLGFVAGWDGKRHEAAASVEEIVLHPDAVQEGAVDVAHDLAILRLNRALAPAPVAVGSAAPQGPFTMVGYPREAPDRQTTREECSGEARRGRWYLGCAVSKGMSGGPVFFGTGTGRRIVGVISAIAGGDAVVAPVDPWVIREAARPYTP